MKNKIKFTMAASIAASINISALADTQPTSVPSEQAVINHFAEISSAMFDDSLSTAKELQHAISHFIEEPTQQNLAMAKQQYVNARVPYQQAEILRFDAENGNISENLDDNGGLESVDAWEGQVNAWPLDEALIDYVQADQYEGEYNSAINIINSTGEFKVGSDSVDITTITPQTLIDMNEMGGSEANVATGIHAIEFLLWGQDLNGVNAGAGERPVSDYYTKADQGSCTNGANENESHKICERRVQYLQTVAQLYVDDLQAMSDEWSEKGRSSEGTLGYDFINNGKGIARMIDSMGDMAAGELASERLKVAVLFGSTEDEHDCFSDYSHISNYYNAVGIINAYRGIYTRVSGEKLQGPSISDLVKAKDKALDDRLNAQLDKVDLEMQKVVDLAQDESNPIKFDQIVGGSEDQKQLVLTAADDLINFADDLGNNISSVISVSPQEFDKGTCPTGDVNDCDS